jgi:CBS domain containing-hemolysin-like protein
MSLAAALALVPALIALNAFFVAAEYALVAIRESQVAAMRGRRDTPAVRAVARLIETPATALAAIQICITLLNLMLGYIGEPAMSRVLGYAFAPLVRVLPAGVVHTISFVLSFLIVTLLTVVLSELLPKALTLRYVEPVARATALPIWWLSRALAPLVWVMNALANAVTRPLGLGCVEEVEKQGHTADEIRLITTEAAADGVLTPGERSLILNTLSLGKRTARQIMVSRIHVDYLDLKRTMADNLKVLERHLHSRLPLCDGGMDKVFGVVTTKEFLLAYEDEGDASVMQLLARPAVFAPETLTIDKLLPTFHHNQTQMLFLVSEYGGVEGIVTLRDVVDELLAEAAPPEPAPVAAAAGE